MAKRMPVPPELEHLIEKRDTDEDRRKQPRRSGAKARAANAATDRRKAKDRRQKKRRKSGN